MTQQRISRTKRGARSWCYRDVGPLSGKFGAYKNRLDARLRYPAWSLWCMVDMHSNIFVVGHSLLVPSFFLRTCCVDTNIFSSTETGAHNQSDLMCTSYATMSIYVVRSYEHRSIQHDDIGMKHIQHLHDENQSQIWRRFGTEGESRYNYLLEHHETHTSNRGLFQAAFNQNSCVGGIHEGGIREGRPHLKSNGQEQGVHCKEGRHNTKLCMKNIKAYISMHNWKGCTADKFWYWSNLPHMDIHGMRAWEESCGLALVTDMHFFFIFLYIYTRNMIRCWSKLLLLTGTVTTSWWSHAYKNKPIP